MQTQYQLKQRINMERRIVRQLVLDLLEAGYTLGINNGDYEDELKESTDIKVIGKHLFLTDDEWIKVYENGTQFGWVRLVYGNDGWDVISDYTVNLEPIMGRVNKMIERYSR